MSDYTKNKKQPQIRPFQAYPNLVNILAETTLLCRELYHLTKPETIAKQLGISEQGYEKHIKKAQKRRGSK